MAAARNIAVTRTLARNQLTLRELKHPLSPMFPGESLFWVTRPNLGLMDHLRNHDLTCKRAGHWRLRDRLRANRRAAKPARRGFFGG